MDRSFPHRLILYGPAGRLPRSQAADLRSAGWEVLYVHTLDELHRSAVSPAPVDLLLVHLTPENGPAVLEAAHQFLTMRPAPVICFVSQLDEQISAHLADLPGCRLLPTNARGALLQTSVSLAVRDREAPTWQVRTEQALRDSEQRFRQVLENSIEAAYKFDLEANALVYISPAIARVTGFSHQEFMAMGIGQILDRVHPEDLPGSLQKLNEGVAGSAAALEIEYRFCDSEGGYRWIMNRFTILRQAAGKPVSIIGSMMDNTAQRLAQQALRESEEKYRVLYENEMYAICIFDIHTFQFLDVNDAFVRLYGYSHQELTSGMTILDVTAEQQDSVDKTRQSEKEGTLFVPLRYHRKKDGTPLPVEIVGGPYIWKGKRVMYALIHDIAPRIQAEQALRESEEKYRVFFENEEYAISIADQQSLRFLDVNDAFVKMLGYTREELVSGMTMLDVSAEVDASTASINHSLQHGTRFNPLRYFSKKDGSTFPVEIVGGPYTLQGKPVIFALVHDISDRRQAQLEVERLLKEKDLLLQEVHHRIKNNMATISSLLGLQAYSLSDPAAIQALAEARGRVQSMMAIYDMLYRAAQFQQVNLRTYLNTLLANIVGTQEIPGVTIHLVKELQSVEAPVNLCFPLGMLVNELVTNAYKYAFEGRTQGTLRVAVRRRGDELEVRVEDDGPGLPQQVDLDSADGFGMGLVMSLAEQMHARLQIESRDGARYRLLIPFDAQA